MSKLMNIVIAVSIIIASGLTSNVFAVDYDKMIGYATMNGGTTGGEGGEVVTPTTVEEFKAYAESETPYVILVDREFKGPNVFNIGSNKTIFGVGTKGFINQIGFKIQCKQNIIIRNLKFTMTGVPVDKSSGENKIVGFNFDPDCIAIQADDDNLPEAERVTRNLWIDHCEFFNEDPQVMTDYDRYDGLVDVKNDAQYITMTWNYFHDHHKACLSGKGASDKYERKTTMAYNRFERIESRIPLFRYGKLHFLNNYLTDCGSGNGVNVRVAALAYVENNYFNDVKKPVFGKIGETGGDGTAHLTGNIWKDCSRLSIRVLDTKHSSPEADTLDEKEEFLDNSYTPSSDYSYSSDVYAVNDVPTNVTNYSGVGIVSYSGVIDTNKKPVVKITAPTGTNGFVAPTNVTIQATATDADGSIAKVQFLNGTTVLGEDTSSPYSFDWNNIHAGTYSIVVKAIDNKGGIGSDSYSLVVNDTTIKKDTTIVVPSGDMEHDFTKSGLVSSFYTITGNLSTSKGTITFVGETFTQCLKMESATTISFKLEGEAKFTLLFNADFNGNVKIDGQNQAVTNGSITVVLPAGEHSIVKGDASNLFYMSAAYTDDITGVKYGNDVYSNELTVFPNPMIKAGSIAYNADKDGEYSLKVMKGATLVESLELNGSKGHITWRSFNIDAVGIYTVILYCDGKEVTQKDIYLPK